MSEVIVITSGKGGVGKTTTTANLGVGLAMRGKSVVLIDTDTGLRNLDLLLGLENRIMPDVYEVGMSNLGLKILYEVLNRREDTVAERVYAPWIDMEQKMRERSLPLFSLESFTEIGKFDFFGFSLQYEMIYSNVLNMLDLAGIPVWARERGEDAPFILGGGPCVYNTEPICDFFDLFIIGEGEEAISELAELFIRWKKEGRPGGRKGFLLRAAQVSGIYVPSLYEPRYDANGMHPENFSILQLS